MPYLKHQKHKMGFTSLSSFFHILREAFNIFFRNGKLLPSVTLVYVSVNSLLFLSYLFATKHLVSDYTAKKTSIVHGGTTAKNYSLQIIHLMKHEARLFVIAYLVFLTLNAITSFIFSVAAISVSSVEKPGEKVRKSWRSALVTFSYKVFLKLGFMLVILVFVVLPIELFAFHPTTGKISTASLVAIIISMALYLHLTVVWNLALVVSVVEVKSGWGAFYRASYLAKDLRLQGYLINVLFGGLIYAFNKGLRASLVGGSNKNMGLTAMNIAPVSLLIAVDFAVHAFALLSYVALYFEGEKICGTVEYAKVQDSSAKFVSSDLP